MKRITIVLVIQLLAFKGFTQTKHPYYRGGHHTSSHGGYYLGSTSSSHRGGHYINLRTSNTNGQHKRR